jgi:hypothetical protein
VGQAATMEIDLGYSVKPLMRGEGKWVWDSEVGARCARDFDVASRDLEVGAGFYCANLIFFEN